MKRWLSLVVLFAAGCASSQGAPIAYSARSPEAYTPPQVRRTPHHQNAPQRSARVDETTPQPDWADGPGTPLSVFALQPDEAARDPRRLQRHRVARGETFDTIARDYAIDPRSLALLNGMRPPYALREGDDVLLPAGAHASSEPSPSTPASIRRNAPAPGAPSVAAGAPARTPAVQDASTSVAVGPAHFTWPLHGEILAHFGAQPGGARLDGIEIAADEGAAVAAADAGEVIYAGSDLSAYGTLVLVRHDNGYVTAYGYARRALVHAGEHVRKGQTIAEIGRIGEGPTKLLFQVRRGREVVDPEPLLGQ